MKHAGENEGQAEHGASSVSYRHNFPVFSSPQPKAPGQLIGWEASVVRPSSVHTFK